MIKDRQVAPKSRLLQGKRVAVGLCGGIAVVEVVKIIREIRRHGADVFAFYTPDVLKFITELPIEWATGRKVALTSDAQVEHLDDFDLVVIVPATLNTITKCSLGLADNVVTLLVAGQLGKKEKCLFVPAMNEALYHHPKWEMIRADLEAWGAQFLINPEEEGRIKLPSPESVVERVLDLIKEK